MFHRSINAFVYVLYRAIVDWTVKTRVSEKIKAVCFLKMIRINTFQINFPANYKYFFSIFFSVQRNIEDDTHALNGRKEAWKCRKSCARFIDELIFPLNFNLCWVSFCQPPVTSPHPLPHLFLTLFSSPPLLPQNFAPVHCWCLGRNITTKWRQQWRETEFVSVVFHRVLQSMLFLRPIICSGKIPN